MSKPNINIYSFLKMNKQKLSDKLNIFKKTFPDISITQVQYNAGFEHFIIDINDLYICKISKENFTELESEAQLLDALKGKLKTNIPEIMYYNEDLLIYKKIKGIELSIELYNKLNPSQKNKLAYDLAFFLYELHNSLPYQKLDHLNISLSNWPYPAEKLVEQKSKIQDSKLKNIFNNVIKEYKILTHDNSSIVLLHNDMILRNIIIDNGKLSGVIDFTDVSRGKFYIDLRLNYTSIPELSKQIAQCYKEISGNEFDLTAIYIYYIATEFSRYLQMLDSKDNQINKVKTRIIETYRLYKKKEFISMI